MEICTECYAIEQGFTENEEGVKVCNSCGFEDTNKEFCEDEYER